MNLTPVVSSNVTAVGYDAETQTLAVRFHNGGLYHYHQVTSESAGALLAAKSIGQFIHHSIKPFHAVTKQPDAGEEKPMPEERKQQVPSVGRVVTYWAYGTPGGEFPAGVARAAIITEVDTPGDPHSDVGLCVLNPTGMFFNRHLKYGVNPGGWDWPVYVPAVVADKTDG